MERHSGGPARERVHRAPGLRRPGASAASGCRCPGGGAGVDFRRAGRAGRPACEASDRARRPARGPGRRADGAFDRARGLPTRHSQSGRSLRASARGLSLRADAAGLSPIGGAGSAHRPRLARARSAASSPGRGGRGGRPAGARRVDGSCCSGAPRPGGVRHAHLGLHGGAQGHHHHPPGPAGASPGRPLGAGPPGPGPDARAVRLRHRQLRTVDTAADRRPGHTGPARRSRRRRAEAADRRGGHHRGALHRRPLQGCRGRPG